MTSDLNTAGRITPAWLQSGLFLIFAFALTVHGLVFVLGLAARFPQAVSALHIDAGCIAALGLALACLTRWARREPPVWGSAVAGGLVGALLYLRTFGWAWLDPTSIDWLLHADLAQHYVGWAMFRQEPWHWPPGLIDGLRYPIGTSVFFTDAHPLLAFLFKPLQALLPDAFQYIGLTYLLNWTLMGCAGALVLRLATRADNDRADAGGQLLLQTLAALLLVLSPTLIARIGHDTLTAQWLIVAALGLSFWRRQSTANGAAHVPIAMWWLLAGIAALTHFYLLGMVLALLVTDVMQASLRERTMTFKAVVRWAGGALVISGIALWLAGAFIVPRTETVDFDNAGRWSADLFSLVDTHGVSRLGAWLPRVRMTHPEQWEGWAYLGLGGLLLVVVAALLATRSPHARSLLRGSALLWLAAITMFVFALGPVVTAAGMTLIDSDWLKGLPVYAVFRSCGRFIWPLHYLLLVAALLVVARGDRRIAIPALVAVCLTQIADLRIHDDFGERRMRRPELATARLVDPRWATWTAGRDHLELVPAYGCGKNVTHWLPTADLAVRHRMTLNGGYVARLDSARWQRYCVGKQELLERGDRRADTLYVVHDAELSAFQASAHTALHCEVIDGLNACVMPRASATD